MTTPTEDKRVLQATLKGLLDQVETLRLSAEKSGRYDDQTAAKVQKALDEADQVKLRLGLLGREEELRDWAHSGEGAAVVKSYGLMGVEDAPGVSGWRTAGPLEGSFKNAVIRIDRETGAYVADNDAAEPITETLKSGAYKDALNFYVRNGWKRDFSWDRYSQKSNNAQRDAAKAAAMKVLQEGIDTSGGAWVLPDFQAQIVKKLPTMTAVRQNATAITVGSDRVNFPKVVYTTDDKYTSGVRFAWTAEAPSSDISEATNPSAGRADIEVFTATAAIILTRANMEDAQFDLMGLVSSLFSEAFLLGEEDAFINGLGVGSPQGVLNHPNATTASSSGGMYVPSGVATSLDWGLTVANAAKGLTGMDAALPPQYEGNAKWFGSKTAYGTIRNLVDGQGRPLWSAGESYPNLSNGFQASLLGYPTAKTNFWPVPTTNAYALALGDMSGYWIADRVGVTVDVLREVRALRDEVVLYARKRVGGKLIHDWRVKLAKCSVS